MSNVPLLNCVEWGRKFAPLLNWHTPVVCSVLIQKPSQLATVPDIPLKFNGSFLWKFFLESSSKRGTWQKRPIYNTGLNEMGLSAFDTKICVAFAETLLFACRIANCNCRSFYLKKKVKGSKICRWNESEYQTKPEDSRRAWEWNKTRVNSRQRLRIQGGTNISGNVFEHLIALMFKP